VLSVWVASLDECGEQNRQPQRDSGRGGDAEEGDADP
jgi:hypothetical protein